MRMTLAALGLLVAGAAAHAGSVTPVSPVAPVSYNYPWCVMGEGLGYSGDCSYQTRAQCLASSSGRWNTSCELNPRFLFQQQHVLQQQRQRLR